MGQVTLIALITAFNLSHLLSRFNVPWDKTLLDFTLSIRSISIIYNSLQRVGYLTTLDRLM